MNTIAQSKLTRRPRLCGCFVASIATALFSSMFDLRAATPLQVAQEAYLKASNTRVNDQFGWSVAVSGDTVVVGALNESSRATGVNGNQSDNSVQGAGAAYVFVRRNGTWTQQAYLKASNTGANDMFGRAVAISGDTIVVGAFAESSSATGVNGNQSDNSASASGAAYVFVRQGTNWTQQAYLKASNAGAGDWFGMRVAVSGDTAIVGALGEDSSSTGVNGNQSDNSATNAGAAYVFVRSGTNWTQQAYLKASNTGMGDNFGTVAVAGDTVVVGAWRESSSTTRVNGDQGDNRAGFSGAAYVFTRSGTNWSQQAYLKASNSDGGDLFGDTVSVSGNTVVVGARGEDSSAAAVNGNQRDNSATNSGAAYVFTRNGTNWSQQAYLKASNTEAGDGFGIRVAVSGDTVVVGAFGESSSATGVNGNQSENTATNSGAAYVFVRNGTTWSQQAYLKASNTEAWDKFGYSVAVSGATAVVGAILEDSSATGVNGDQCDNSASGSSAAYVFDLNAGPKTVITGPPEIAVEQPPGTDLRAGAATVDFGSAPVGGVPGMPGRPGVVPALQRRTFSIKNTGLGALTNVTVAITGANSNDFRVTAQPPATVSGPCGGTFSVDFFSGGIGRRLATLHIISSDPDESPFDIALTGTGTPRSRPIRTVSTRAEPGAMPLQVAQVAYLKASNTGANDSFGQSVAVSGDTVAVGAASESSNATGVNGNQADNSATDSGAVYVFVRRNGTWVQEAYLKASNAEAGDLFGCSVAMASDTVVVGAERESSSATGVNGNQGDNSARHAGAAYVFVRNGTTWIQQAYLKASNAEGGESRFGDGFGHSVAVSGRHCGSRGVPGVEQGDRRERQPGRQQHHELRRRVCLRPPRDQLVPAGLS
jgi:hypothetical protein